MRQDHKSEVPDPSTGHRADNLLEPPPHRGPAVSFAPLDRSELDEWDQSPLADQMWHDWRAVNMGRYEASANILLEQVWAAGLIDGAATISTFGNRFDSMSARIKLEVTQSHGEQGRINLMRFQRAIGGLGAISGPYPQVFPAPYYYVWRTVSQTEVEQVWKVVGAFVGLAKFIEFRRALAAGVPAQRHGNGGRRGKRYDHKAAKRPDKRPGRSV